MRETNTTSAFVANEMRRIRAEFPETDKDFVVPIAFRFMI
jgi:hypothetical protein